MQREFTAPTLTKAIHQATNRIEKHKIPTISYKSWSTTDFIKHFYSGRGRTVSLNNMGLLNSVRREASRLAIDRNGGFKDQIRDEVRIVKTGRVRKDFKNSYSFGNIRRVMRGGTLTGGFRGNTKLRGSILSFSGDISVVYSDIFEDALSLVQIRYGSSSSADAPDWLRRISNSKGTPYKIIGVWQERFEEKIVL